MIIGISLVVVAFCIVVGVQMIQKQNTLRKLQEQESKLTKQYEKELQLSKDLKDQESYVKTDEYVEEMARKLGLLYPDEVIFKPEE
jgi:cell division protein DivIC